jgi:hypothetical protein
MANRLPVHSGRHVAACDNGRCALTGNEASSKLEGHCFVLLNAVLGGGLQDVQLNRGRFRADMVFPLPDKAALVIEFDGAFWHTAAEDRDERKNYAAYEHWNGQCIVIRVREAPLTPIDGHDVVVPAGASAVTVATTVLLHLTHWSSAGGPGTVEDKLHTLVSSRGEAIWHMLRALTPRCLWPISTVNGVVTWP